MNKQILVPLDGSSLAEAVLPCAAALARATSSTVMLLRSVPPLTLIEPMGGAIYLGDAYWKAYQYESEEVLHYLTGIATSLTRDGITVQTVVEEGEPATRILEYAAANADIQFIAMATHGRSGLSRLLLGSVAESVLHNSPVPVLMFRSHGKDNHDVKHVSVDLANLDRPYRNILVPLDGSDLSEQALAEAQKLAIDTGAAITLLSVALPVSTVEDQDQSQLTLWIEELREEKIKELSVYLFRLAQPLRDAGSLVDTHVRSGDPAEEIIRASERDNIDLIVMATHGRGGLQRLRLGSVAAKVVQGAHRPVLLVRARKSSDGNRAVETKNDTGLVTR